MLSFAVYSNGKTVADFDLSGAYLVGTDDVPLRAEITFDKGTIHCKKRATGPAGLVLLFSVDGVGTIMLDTIRLQEREKPYILQVELARARLLRIQHKLEDWSLHDFAGAEDIGQQVMQAREALIKSLQADSPEQAATRGDDALAQAIKASEALTKHHAEMFLTKRKQVGAFNPAMLGCAVRTEQPTEAVCQKLADAFDSVTVPIIWREIEPTEKKFQWDALDKWIEALSKRNVELKASSLLSFDERHVPEWLFIWEHDFDTIRDLAYEHARRVLNRYGQYIKTWDVISGIHADNCFTFSFEQLMELTRMTTALTKQVCPDSTAIVHIVAPWGEYYARNQRSIPPTLYADMTVQSGANFDAFGLDFRFGAARDGMYPRDMFQISAMLDTFTKIGKPLYLTAVQAPSGTNSSGKKKTPGSTPGMWRKPWSEDVQATWLREFMEVALSKPIVEAVSWYELSDHKDSLIPTGGLLDAKLKPKKAYRAWSTIHKEINDARKNAHRGSAV